MISIIEPALEVEVGGLVAILGAATPAKCTC